MRDPDDIGNHNDVFGSTKDCFANRTTLIMLRDILWRHFLCLFPSILGSPFHVQSLSCQMHL